MKPLCLLPWTSIYIDPIGDVAPCCKYKLAGSAYNVTRNTIEEYVNSDQLKSIKNEMLTGEWPEGCIRCKTEEENRIKSKRQLDYERWKQHFDAYTEDKGFITANINFGNTCNLKCITCNPRASSKWRKEYIDVYDIDIPNVEVLNHIYSDNVYNSLSNIIHFDIAGGEPFLSEVDKQLDLLQKYVDSGKSNSMTLHYVSNAQVYPDSKWWDLWQHFRGVEIQLSIDGVGNRYEYIRYPAKNDLLLKNVDMYLEQQNLGRIKLSVSHTVSAYNIYYLKEMFDWCYNIGLPKPWCGRVHNPNHLRPCVYPIGIKQKIIDHLKNMKDIECLRWMQYLIDSDSSMHFDHFLTYKDKHDLYRGTNFAKTFPEVEELINGFQ